ncbi:MAG TPA: hypothetical protein DCW83_05585 [Saprospirales bacterium]|jgi:hypothetical protein|nr:hypothetical protein [Saprospiraceae bacterium]MDG1100960.1 hypothetical protein [Saprospiraceae bacterium]MDG1716918.1 hypothetical protein [Saprospiraceae bacterium]HAI57984.1 hypothetical protein [Saprospirales bacterium]HAW04139.1 hypothetical protein [Saprospirales bacterium]|tara:strand:- start:281 stop:865 length:585 start_codon:yes stop_codon:yes gene_type:complete
MKNVFKILIYLLAILLAYILYSSIKEPIKFQAAKQARKAVVVKQLEDIRTAQEIYRSITGEFAGDFDTLSTTLRNGQIPFIVLSEDPEFPGDSEKFLTDTTYASAVDSIMSLGINLDSLRYVPFSGGKTFDIAADTLTYQSTLVNVVEVGTYWKDFMGKYADPKYAKYDQSYEPAKRIKFGDLNKPNISGSWDR